MLPNVNLRELPQNITDRKNKARNAKKYTYRYKIM
jgi:hypothetical protein